MYERNNILSIFEETRGAISRGDSATIKALSNKTTNSASLTNDPDNIAVAVIIYALSKLIEKKNCNEVEGCDIFYAAYVKSIDRIISALKKGDDEAFRKEIKVIRSSIEKLSGKFKEDIKEVFRKASINKASKLYEHGLSMERTANLLGITLFELAGYSGERYGIESEMKSVDVKTRIKLVENFFK